MLVQLPGEDEGAALRHQYLALLLHALHTPVEAELPRPPPDRPISPHAGGEVGLSAQNDACKPAARAIPNSSLDSGRGTADDPSKAPARSAHLLGQDDRLATTKRPAGAPKSAATGA
jgi:hypothetical protein